MIQKYLLPVMLVGIFSCTNKSAENANEKITKEAEMTNVYFISPENDAIVKSPVRIAMGLNGMETRPAGEIITGTGHHHIIINGSFVEEGNVVLSDSFNIHYGDGRTETELDLKPGNYTLTLQFANGVHLSYGERVSSTISIEVVE